MFLRARLSCPSCLSTVASLQAACMCLGLDVPRKSVCVQFCLAQCRVWSCLITLFVFCFSLFVLLIANIFSSESLTTWTVSGFKECVQQCQALVRCPDVSAACRWQLSRSMMHLELTQTPLWLCRPERAAVGHVQPLHRLMHGCQSVGASFSASFAGQ